MAAVAATTTRPEPARTTVTFTFDDTLANQLPALEVLDRYGMNATIYVNSPRLDLNTSFLTRSALQRLEARGFEVGGHTLDHVDLESARPEEVRRQVCDDRARLMQMGFRVTSFAYPLGAVDGDAARTVRTCGYNSARALPGLRSPGYGCSRCPTAELLPPLDRWRIRTPASVRPSTTLQRLKYYVTQAEENGGGWVPLVFHNVCPGACAGNAIDIDTFTGFVAWLSQRPATTSVATVDQVIGGEVRDRPSTGQQGVRTLAVLGSESLPVTGRNIYRGADNLVLYTREEGGAPSTGTNEFGTEVAVVDGRVKEVVSTRGDMAVPANGFVLSGNGEAARWLRTNARVGAEVRLVSKPAPTDGPESWASHLRTGGAVAALLALALVGARLVRTRRRTEPAAAHHDARSGGAQVLDGGCQAESERDLQR